MIKLKTLNKILNKKEYEKYNEKCTHYDNYIFFKKQLEKKKINQISLEEMINIIKTSEYYNYYIEIMNNIDESLIYTSEGHGIKHNERVSLFAFAIGIMNNLKKQDLKILLEAAKYHDIGRVNDEEDAVHGYKSSLILEKIMNDLSREDKDILKVVCICHSLADNNYYKIAIKYKIKDKKRCKKIMSILKDADALDRVRLRGNELDIKYLRNKYSKQLVLAAYNLFYNY